MSEYVPLWCKTNFSFLEGASHAEELLTAAGTMNIPALAVTDRNGVYGIVRAHVAAKAGATRLITGAQVSVGKASILLLCQNREGYGGLCELLSRGHRRNPKGQCSVEWDEVSEHAGGLVALLLPDAGGLAAGKLPQLKDAFAGDLFAVVSRHRRPEDVGIERETRAAARRFDIPLVAANEVLYHAPERRRLQDVLVCIQHGVTLAEAGTRIKSNGEFGLKSHDEMGQLFRDAPELLARTLDIAERCTFSMAELEYRYPDETVPEGFTTATWLRKLTHDGAMMRYGGCIPEQVKAQLDRELGVIETLRYSGYFLTMWEIVQYCTKNEILCQGRGSAANSAVCFCLGITAIDPVRMNLLFERFLSLERAEPPDIDLDIEHQRREEVIQHMYQKYGRDRAAMVANVVRYRPRSAVRDVGKVFGLSEVTLDRCAKLMPHWGASFGDLFAEAGLDMNALANRHFAAMAQEIMGFPRHLSIHPGGFLLGSEPVSRLVPVENASMPDRTVIQWDKDDIDALGLFKVDLLGLGALTHLDFCFRLLKEHQDIDLSMATIPADDSATFEMLQRADTVGVFQIESRAQMAMLPRLKPQNYYDIVIEVSLVRPGPITGGMVHPYLRRRAGEEAITYPHPSLEPVLGKTLGIPLFQEQVMKLAVVAADYTPGEADQLRRDMAAWKQAGRIQKHQEKLISRMVAKGIEKEFAERVFEQIKGFGEYGFPESHAASFALIAYATAYLKRHHPAIFACGLLNAWPMGFYRPSTVIDDAKRHRVRVLPVSIAKSEWNCTMEKSSSGELAVRVGLRFVKGLAKSDWELVRSARALGAFRSLQDFSARCRVARDTFEQLSQSGAFGCFGVSRRSALWTGLGDRDTEVAAERLVQYEERMPALGDLNPAEVIYWDYNATEHSVRGHIVEPYREQFRAEGLPDAATLARFGNGDRVSYAGYVICRQMPGNAGGVLFMTMEDESGFVNLVVWEKVFTEFRTMILTHWLLGVRGKLQVADGVVHVVAESFWVPKLDVSATETKAVSHDFY